MKSLMSWICLFAASTTAFAEEDLSAYRLGNYTQAVMPLFKNTGKDGVADYYIGRLYLYGYGQLKNTQLAIRYFTQSAEKNFLPAIQLMARYSLLEQKNLEDAVRWFKKAAALGDVSAQMFMAAAYIYGLGVKPNDDTATHYYIDAAKNGNAVAQFALAEHFLDSRHASNNKLGLIWLSRSASSGNPKALTRLGSLSLSGKLVTKDVNKGIELLHQAVAQNFAPAMIELGDLALAQNQPQQAIEWYQRAAKEKESLAYLHLAHAYLQDKSPIYDSNAGFLAMLKAAQEGLLPAKKELADLYQKGIGVAADPNLAQQWLDQVVLDEKKKSLKSTTGNPLEQAALWLSNGATQKLEETDYKMKGILSAWNNAIALKNNVLNQAPQMAQISRNELFKPQFELTQPNHIPINNYYDALVSKEIDLPANQWTYPLYPLNKNIQALEQLNSYVVSQSERHLPYADAQYPLADSLSHLDWMNLWNKGWQKQVQYLFVFNQMYSRAILGDAQSQFDIGQMFQYGISVEKNLPAAIVFYQNAAEQQHLGAEYNLGILYLENAKDANDYQLALNWLTDSAFKGNKKAQYVLSRLLDKGLTTEAGQQVIKPNHEQAVSMLYLSAANNFGPAQYELAELLSRQYKNGLSIEAKNRQLALVRQLYESAVGQGVAQALLPLAFYNAMNPDRQKQSNSFMVANMEAKAGDAKAALLLGLLYDRGIGVSASPEQAIYWYQRAGQNAVSQFIIGTYTVEGRGLFKDEERGKNLLQASAQAEFSYAHFNLAVVKHQLGQEFLPSLITAYSQGNSHAGVVLADYYLTTNSDANTMNQAKTIFLGLAEKGDQFAQLKLAYMFEKGLGTEVKPAEALHWYTASANQGNAQAQYLLGQLYQLGTLGAPDYQLAKQWYQKAAYQLPKAWDALGFIDETVDDDYTQALKAYAQAAAKHDLIGAYNLALMYEYGKGVPVDYSKAKVLFEQAAHGGISQAMNQLAELYFYGLGQDRDTSQALVWYKKAANLGNSNALYVLGLMSETGVGTALDMQQAFQYYAKAAEQDNDKAMLAMARIYHYGLGVAKDQSKSVALYEKLAERQNAYAQYQLANYYLESANDNKMPGKARQLLEKAGENGNLQAIKALQKLEAQTQDKVSFIESVSLNSTYTVTGQDAELMYLEAMNEWNRGDEYLSRIILHGLVVQHPGFAPAKRAYEQLNQLKLIKNFG